MALRQRFFAFNLKLVGRNPADYARELEELLESLWNFTLGIPGGFLNIVATILQAGVASSAGDRNTGWAAADHNHRIETSAPTSPTGPTPLEGTGTSLMRADATIRDGVMADAVSQPDGYVLQADSTDVLGVSWTPGLTRDEVVFVRGQFESSLESSDRGARRNDMICDGRFASDRRSPCDPSSSSCCTISSRGAR